VQTLTMANPSTIDNEPPDNDRMEVVITTHVSHVRFSIVQRDNTKTVPIPSILHKLMNKIRDIDNNTIFNDIEGNVVSMENFPVDKDVFDKAFGTVVPNGRNPQVILGLTINSTINFSPLKSALLPVLHNMNVFMRPHHSTSWKSLDAIPIAHIQEVRPSFADKTQVKAAMITMLQQCIHKVGDTDEYKFLRGDKSPEIPELMLYNGRALGKIGDESIHSDVIEIYVAREHAPMMKYLFEISTSLTTRPFQLVPRDFKFNHPAIYGKILNKQNNYLETHRNIAIVAIPTQAMEHCITDLNGKNWNTLQDAILSVSGVTHVHACKRTLDLGKWNISTNINDWAHVKTWLDTQLSINSSVEFLLLLETNIQIMRISLNQPDSTQTDSGTHPEDPKTRTKTPTHNSSKLAFSVTTR
jgi:hypothetical protein